MYLYRNEPSSVTPNVLLAHDGDWPPGVSARSGHGPVKLLVTGFGGSGAGVCPTLIVLSVFKEWGSCSVLTGGTTL